MSNLTVPYVVGLDAGGTKTKATVMSLDKKVLATFEGGGMNVNSFGSDVSKQNLKNLLLYLNQQDPGFENLKAICAGVAGISNPLTHLMVSDGVLECGIVEKPIVVGDQKAAFYGAHEGRDGIILISGTGSICYGQRGDKVGRSGGYGHLIDDEGSAYALGRDVLACVIRSRDGRNEPTVMEAKVLEKLNLTEIAELIPFIYDPTTTKKDIASLAPIIMDGYFAGERAAEKVLEKAAEELVKLIVAVMKQLEMESANVAIAGSVILNNPILKPMVEMILYEQGQTVVLMPPKQDASYGACLIALESLN